MKENRKVINNKVNPDTEGHLKKEYQDVVDFYINTTPYQHLFFLDLIKQNLSFFSEKHSESFTVDEDYHILFNGPYIQLNIK